VTNHKSNRHCEKAFLADEEQRNGDIYCIKNPDLDWSGKLRKKASYHWIYFAIPY